MSHSNVWPGTASIVINQGVRQGYVLSSTLFNNNLDDILNRWKEEATSGVYIGEIDMKILPYADDLIIIHGLEQGSSTF